jgi:hypothetical protein
MHFIVNIVDKNTIWFENTEENSLGIHGYGPENLFYRVSGPDMPLE